MGSVRVAFRLGLVLLLAAAGGCKKKDYASVSIPSTHVPYSGPGFAVKLPPGWRGVAGNGGVNFYTPDANGPFQSNLFIKARGNGPASPSAILQGLKKEMEQLMPDVTTSDETDATIGGEAALQARYKGTLNKAGLPRMKIDGLMVAVRAGNKGYELTFIGQEGEYEKHAAEIESIIASFKPE